MGMALHVEKTSASMELGPVEQRERQKFERWAKNAAVGLNEALDPMIHESMSHDGVASFEARLFNGAQRPFVMAAMMAVMLQAEELFEWGGAP